jgi:hypothetical protein
VYKSRFWYDSAGPVFPNQVEGLTEGMKIPVSQLVFGTVSLSYPIFYFEDAVFTDEIVNRIIRMALASGTSMRTSLG